MSVKQTLESILKQVAESQNTSNYEIVYDENSMTGDGFLSQAFTGKVRRKDTGKLIEVYIKQAPKFRSNGSLNLQEIYNNELYFYSKIFKELEIFQKKKEKSVGLPFNDIPQFYAGNAEREENMFLALENLTSQNYKLHEKRQFLDQHHLETLFETYGRFHALTFAYKEQLKEKYQELISPVTEHFAKFIPSDYFKKFSQEMIELSCEVIKEKNLEYASRLKKCLETFHDMAVKSTTYSGKYSCLTHGDCWSNNVLFKYNENGRIEKVKLLDFQLIRDSTPVHDLSYFFYSGASKEELDKFDTYLKTYYKSFSEFARKLGSDPEKLLPLDVLKSDWKKYSPFGILMALSLWRIKFMKKEEISKATDNESVRPGDKIRKEGLNINKNQDFRKNVSDIFLHALERNII